MTVRLDGNVVAQDDSRVTSLSLLGGWTAQVLHRCNDWEVEGPIVTSLS